MDFYLVCKNEDCNFIAEAEESGAFIWFHFGKETACNDCGQVGTLALITEFYLGDIGGWAEATREKGDTIGFDFNNTVEPHIADHYEMLAGQYKEMRLACE